MRTPVHDFQCGINLRRWRRSTCASLDRVACGRVRRRRMSCCTSFTMQPMKAC
ncbi:uncharacterized protein K489DRAFT_375199 [Dissoconium aciculare CBS 342.82]|uniref:Uncharacterized protein n=1 Tax=Dissoconium aciculare CBS 342.82 TaxID=1314786 RepID=A0A6J3MGN6_9PEZI|nr:uncharacterized protein K489DRAFT_375199 [Dissoconium aciculare CBS 342.82]KAF1827115.1 hypothetical protein K489DRAFT_375199 [Dissoconium aciculare CBS 342.82]